MWRKSDISQSGFIVKVQCFVEYQIITMLAQQIKYEYIFVFQLTENVGIR